MNRAANTTTPTSVVPSLRPWAPPMIRELPKLSELTLASPIGGGGGTGGGGSTVFTLVLVASTLLTSTLGG